MGSFSNHAILLALLLVLIEALISTGAGLRASSNTSGNFVTYRPKTTVRIDSKMGAGSYVVVRCRSDDKDVGVQKVMDGQFYGWRFRPNIWGTTRFICSLVWQKGMLKNVFYEYDRDIDRCGKDCRWFANTTAVYGIFPRDGVTDIAFSWEPLPVACSN